MTNKEIKNCQFCNKEFIKTQNRGQRIYCSDQCCNKMKASRKSKEYCKEYLKNYKPPQQSNKIKMTKAESFDDNFNWACFENLGTGRSTYG